MAFGRMLGVLHVCMSACPAYLCVFMFVSGRAFSPEQQEIGWLWVCDCQENSQNPFKKETRLHAPLKGAAHDIIHTHPLSL